MQLLANEKKRHTKNGRGPAAHQNSHSIRIRNRREMCDLLSYSSNSVSLLVSMSDMCGWVSNNFTWLIVQWFDYQLFSHFLLLRKKMPFFEIPSASLMVYMYTVHTYILAANTANWWGHNMHLCNLHGIGALCAIHSGILWHIHVQSVEGETEMAAIFWKTTHTQADYRPLLHVHYSA